MSFLSANLVAECDIQTNITKVVNTISSAKILGDNIAVDPFVKFQRLCHTDRMGDVLLRACPKNDRDRRGQLLYYC